MNNDVQIAMLREKICLIRVNNYFCFVISVLLWTLMYATTTEALTIRPLKEEINVNPGSVTVISIDVGNSEPNPVLVSLKTRSFHAGIQEGVADFDAKDDSKYLKWVQLPQNELSLLPNQSKKISYTLVVPPDVEPGGYYFAVFARTRPVDQTNSTVFSNELGVLYFLTVNGDIKNDVVLSNFQFVPTKLFFFPARFSYILHNQGNIHLKPQGDIHITNIFSKKKVDQVLNVDEKIILPETSRVFSSVWLESNGLTWFSSLNPFRFGVYEAEIQIEGIRETEKLRFVMYSPTALTLACLGFVWFVVKKVYVCTKKR